jgi:pilus assembly protein FimV
MAYNKSKYVEAAQKLLNQGKVAQAIAEYQQILKYEPRDQVTLMTIGELYIRQGETFQAIDYFERLAQLFVSDGFLTKAIAVYKRIAKLAPEEIRPLEKLADLYVQQGVMSEARPLFLQLAELHLKNNKQPEAVALLKKLLLAEPDNLRIQIRLADLYQAMGQSGEALDGYISAAQRALARGDQAECEKLADKALQINPKSLDAMIVKARAFTSAGNIAQAAEILERVPDLEKGGEPAELLLDLYVKNTKWDEATALALKIFATDEKNFTATQKVTEALLESGQGERAMSVLSRIRIPMIDAGEHEGVVHLLNELAGRMPGRIEPLEWLVDTYGRMSDSFRLPDALANLGDALVTSGKLERAKEVYQQLLDREPESDSAKRKMHDVMRKMGLLHDEPVKEPEAAVVAETMQTELPQAPSPKVRPGLIEEAPKVVAQAAGQPTEPDLDEDTQKFIAQSLTDVDLFASYGLTQKAIGLLEAILRRAPMHTPTLEKLLDFVLGAGDDRRTAELAAQLEHIHAGRGDKRSSERFGELRRRFQRAAGLTDDEIGTAVAAAMPQPVETQPVHEGTDEFAIAEGVTEAAAIAAPEAIVENSAVTEAVAPQAVEQVPEIEVLETAPKSDEEEVDLSAEWASLLEETKQPVAQVEHVEAVAQAHAPATEPEATEFELPEFSIDEIAPSAVETPETVAAHSDSALKDDPVVGEFEIAGEPAVVELDTSAFAEISSELPAETHSVAMDKVVASVPETPLPEEELTALPVPEHASVASEESEKTLEEPQPAVSEKTAEALPVVSSSEPEFEVDQDFELVLEPEAVTPAHEMQASMPEVGLPSREDLGEVSLGLPEQKEKEVAAKGSGAGLFSSDAFLSDLAKEIDELGLGQLTPPAAISHEEQQATAKSEAAAAANLLSASNGEPGPLKEVFEEFRAELGEMGVEDEDLETHYNLGIAFREMGLLEEAIGEFQKVAKANDRGRAFRYAMQCSTLLGLAFMEKGQPGIAAIWYERALLTPGLDTESKLALRYDLGVAQESAGDLDTALKSFSQVYAVNIDYRDVADRIASLQKPAH